MLSGIIAAGGFLIILAGSALSQQTALGQNYQGVYVDGTFVGYVAENVDVKDVILQARRKLAEESASRIRMSKPNPLYVQRQVKDLNKKDKIALRTANEIYAA